LVTSRSPLGLAGEHEYAVAPLDVPAESEAFESLARNDSVSVFVTRAQAVDREFQLSDGNASDVAGICRAVDGLPLALELAAMRDVGHGYATERLEERGAQAVQGRHARYYTSFAERLGPELIGPQMPRVIGQLTVDHDNLRAALAHVLTREPDLGFRLIAALR